MAHFLAISQVLPRDVKLHLMTDPDGSLLAGIMFGMRERILWGQADVTVVTFNKGLSNPKKRGLVGVYKKHLLDFAKTTFPYAKNAHELRREYIRVNHTPSIAPITDKRADWYSAGVETMYEPQKRVGIYHQRPSSTSKQHEERFITLLDRSSLHAVDTFFNFTRQRVSYFHRPGVSRSSGVLYNQFQAYRPDMLQKLIDITRVYYNWVEPRTFRLAKKFDNVEAQAATTGIGLAKALKNESERAQKVQKKSTPAMRLGLARGPVALRTILYKDWMSEAMAPKPLP